MTRLFLLFIVVPTIELILLIQIGQWIGTLPTLGLIVFTGALGAFLARRQGVQVLTRIHTEIRTGQLPADPIIDGVIVLVAGAFLLTPGILTDIVGFLCLIPASRRLIKQTAWARIQQAIREGRIVTNVTGSAGGYPPRQRRQQRHEDDEAEDVITIDPDDYEYQ